MITNTVPDKSGILKVSKNNCNSSKASQLMCPWLARICWGHSTGCFIYSFVIPAVISKKTLSSKGFSWQFQKKFYMKIIANIIPNRFSCKFAFIIFFLSFLTNQRQESGFRQVGGLITRNISVFL